MSNVDEGSERRLFEAAVQLDGEERERFLVELEQRRGEVARRVRALVAAHERPGLDSTPAELPASFFSPSAVTEVAGNGASPRARLGVPGPPRLADGALLADRYFVHELLGRGGMGEVYRAEDRTLGVQVALKVLPSATEPQRLARMLAEVRIARQVSHRRVCRVHDVGESDGLHFLTMELVDGEDLAALIARPGGVPVDRAAELGEQLCEGLAAVHAKGILHRDLKPANVMVDRDGGVQLTDFGLAGLAGDALPGGTPAYMAPELGAGQGATVQSELYALGLILFELFTGEQAFRGDSTAELRRRHREEPPRSPAELRPEVPAAVAETILRCLAKDPSRRPPSAAAVRAALLGGEVPGEAGRSVRLRRWSPPPPPGEPYPVLLPYRHRQLLAGRDGEIDRLRAWLELPRPIVGLSAISGTGKSSLLAGGLYPDLWRHGRPAALERYPADPGIAGRLLGGLLDVTGGVALSDGDLDGFVALLERSRALAGGVAPVLIVDQAAEESAGDARIRRVALERRR
ncbi:MAG: serine/threonine-protein kinase, partial [Acidobacteriota bacterium]